MVYSSLLYFCNLNIPQMNCSHLSAFLFVTLVILSIYPADMFDSILVFFFWTFNFLIFHKKKSFLRVVCKLIHVITFLQTYIKLLIWRMSMIIKVNILYQVNWRIATWCKDKKYRSNLDNLKIVWSTKL